MRNKVNLTRIGILAISTILLCTKCGNCHAQTNPSYGTVIIDQDSIRAVWAKGNFIVIGDSASAIRGLIKEISLCDSAFEKVRAENHWLLSLVIEYSMSRPDPDVLKRYWAEIRKLRNQNTVKK